MHLQTPLDQYQVASQSPIKKPMQKEPCLLDLMSLQQRQALLAKASSAEYASGQVLFKKGDFADRFFLVNKGQIKLIRITPSGDEKIFKVFLPTGLIAEMAMFMPHKSYPMTAIAEVKSQVSIINKHDLLGLIESSPKLAVRIMAFMSQRISTLMNTIDTLTQVNAEQRLVMFLAQIYKKQRSGNLSIQMPYSKKVLAHQICAKPETLSRILKKFKQQQLLQERGSRLYLLDIPKLCRSVDLLPDIFTSH